MKNVLKKIKENKKIVLIVLGAIVLIVGVIVLISALGKEKVDEEEMLTNELEKIGRNYYEDYYYVSAANSDDLKDKKEYLENFSSVGLKINLENLQRYNNTLKDKNETNFKNTEKNKKCNAETSMVTIYPTDPYGKKDYKISVYLDCSFDKKEEKK